MSDIETVDSYLTEEMLNEDHLDFMLDEIDTDNKLIDKMIDESIDNKIF